MKKTTTYKCDYCGELHSDKGVAWNCCRANIETTKSQTSGRTEMKEITTDSPAYLELLEGLLECNTLSELSEFCAYAFDTIKNGKSTMMVLDQPVYSYALQKGEACLFWIAYRAYKPYLENCILEGPLATGHGAQREQLIAKSYGVATARKEDKMFDSRNTGSIAFKATSAGRHESEVLTRSEQLDLCKDKDKFKKDGYEMDDSDLVDYGARTVKDKYTNGQVRSLMKNSSDSDIDAQIEEAMMIGVPEDKGPFITAEQKQANFDFYSRRVKEAKKLGTIKWIGAMVFKAIEQSVRSFTIMEDGKEVEISVPTFFPKSELSYDEEGYEYSTSFYSVFWHEVYGPAKKAMEEKEAKEKTAKAKEPTVSLMEIEQTINAFKLAGEAKLYKRDIYSMDFDYPTKKRLWDECDRRVAALSA